MNWRNMVETARDLAGQTQPQPASRPRQEPLKRAVSTAYYAMFHALCQSNADALIGTRNDYLGREAWNRVYRAVNHRQARQQLRQIENQIPTQARGFATAFALLQSMRHDADYNPCSRFSRNEVINLVDTADAAIREFMEIPRNQRRAMAAFVLLQERGGGNIS